LQALQALRPLHFPTFGGCCEGDQMKKIFVFLICTLIVCASSFVVFAAEEGGLVWDTEDLVSEAQEALLSEQLEGIKFKYSVEAVVVTVADIPTEDPLDYAEYIFFDNGFGCGENKDGVLLLVSDSEGSCALFTNGIGRDAIDSDTALDICNEIKGDLSEGKYAKAFSAFADECDYYINGEINGFPYDFTVGIIGSLVFGFVVAFIVTGIMKGQLKSVRKQDSADRYTKKGSMDVTGAKDLYLYSNITRIKKENNSSGSSRGSSGRGASIKF